MAYAATVIVERSLLGVAALILLIGVVVFLQRRADNELVPAAVSSQPAVVDAARGCRC